MTTQADDLFEDAPCGLLATLPDGTITRVNRTLLRWLGQPSEQVVGRRFADLLTPASRIYHETHYAPLLHVRDAVHDVSLDLVRIDGSRLPVLVSATLSRDGAHVPTAVRVAIVDATERRQHERELLDASRRERERRELAEIMRLAFTK
jgi:sigma-B regulation protein RsbU (phosphoserine phosphatase)